MASKAHYTDALLKKQAIFNFQLEGFRDPVTVIMSRDRQQPVKAIHATMGQVTLSNIGWTVQGKIRACVQSAAGAKTTQEFKVLSCREVG